MKEKNDRGQNVSEWKEHAAQQLIRYEALFTLLNDIQGEEIAVIARQVTKQWKYFANAARWRLVVYDENDYMVIDGLRNEAQVKLTDENGLSEWDISLWKDPRPVLISVEDVDPGLPLPGHLIDGNIIQIQSFPVFSKGICIATMTVSGRNKPFDELDNRYIRLLSNYFADRVLSLMLQNRAIQVLHTKATRDALTGILNRGAVLEQFDTILALGKRLSHHVSIVIADIDCFKAINDTYGHQTGDKVIHDIARRFEEAARESDCVGRFGGEEFLIILNSCDTTQVKCVAERFRKAVCNSVFTIEGPSPKSIAVTVSAGTASTNASPGYNALSLIREADIALYESKRNGKNRVTIST